MTNRTQMAQLLSSYADRINAIFDALEGDKSTIKPGLTSSSATSITSLGEESGVQRALAPSKTKCFSGCGRRWGGGGGGGKVAVDILNSVGTMTAQIINSSALAASVVLPPLTNTLGNVVVNWMNSEGQQPPKGTQPPQVIVYPPGGGGQGPPPQPGGQWVWAPPGQWVWVPAGQTPPPGGNITPPPYNPYGQTQPPYNPYGQTQPPYNSYGQTQPPYNPYGQTQPPGSANANATAIANSYPSAAPSPTRSRMPQQKAHMDRKLVPDFTRTIPSMFSSAKSLDSNPAIEKAYRDIYKTLEDMEMCLHNILGKFN